MQNNDNQVKESLNIKNNNIGQENGSKESQISSKISSMNNGKSNQLNNKINMENKIGLKSNSSVENLDNMIKSNDKNNKKNKKNKIQISKKNFKTTEKLTIIDEPIYIPDNMHSPKEEEINDKNLNKSGLNTSSYNIVSGYISPDTSEDSSMNDSIICDRNIFNSNNNNNTNDNTDNSNNTSNTNNAINNKKSLLDVEDISEPYRLRSNSLPELLPSQIYTTLSGEQSSDVNTPNIPFQNISLNAKINSDYSYSDLNQVKDISSSETSITTLSGQEMECMNMNKAKLYNEKSKLNNSINLTPDDRQKKSIIGDIPNVETSISHQTSSGKDNVQSVKNEKLEKSKDDIVYPDYYKNPWLFLKSEIYGEDAIPEKLSELKKERIQNFLAVPVELEKFLNYGILICLDSFLYTFTILPIRLIIAIKSMFKGIFVKGAFKLRHKSDLLKCLLILFCCIFLQYIDVSRLYHFIRGQNIVKLYLIYNLMENFDKLCSAFGHDVLDSLLAENIIKKSNKGSRFPVIAHFIVSLAYLMLHTVVLFYLVVSLNVAINSYNNALLSFLISNQFGEIKSSVFKRFERENLFQLTCSDIVERFQMLVFLVIITSRNFLELSGTGAETLTHFYTLFSKSILSPASFSSMIPKLDILQTFQSSNFPEFCEKIVNLIVTKLTNFINSPTYQLLAVLITPVVVIYGSEMFVDYLKHTFITKFNQIKPSVYNKYRDSLCKDFAGNKKYSDNQILDRSGYVSRRIGFVTLPLACLTIRIFMQTLKMLGYLYIDGERLNSFSIQNFFNEDGTINIKFTKHALSNFVMIFILIMIIYTCILVFKLYLSLYIHTISYKRVQEMKKEQENEAAAEAQREEMKNLVKDGPVDYHQYQRQPNDIPPIRDDKLDKIDRYMMVKSRIP